MTTADIPRRQRRSTINTSTALIGYTRVSTDEQARSGLGLTAQRKAIRAAAAERGRELVDIFEDAGVSGKALNGRPGLAAALAAIREGRAGGLIVSKLDRLSRSLLDFASLMECSRREGWTLIALDLGVDTSTPTGELMATVLAAFAQHERRLIGQRTRDALAVKRNEGVRLGRPRQIPDDVVETIATRRAERRTFQAIADELNGSGIRTASGGEWTAQSVHSAYMSRVRNASTSVTAFVRSWASGVARSRPLSSGAALHADVLRPNAPGRYPDTLLDTDSPTHYSNDASPVLRSLESCSP